MFQALLEKVKGNNLLIKLLTGTIVAQIFGVILAPLMMRIYDPVDFSSLGIFRSTVVIVSVVGCLKFDRSIILPKFLKESYALSHISIFISLSFFALFTLILTFFSEQVVSLFGLELIEP